MLKVEKHFKYAIYFNYMNDTSKTFILGLGHQKCGTSWLYNYLTQSSYFCKGIAKEYHIWDALDIPLLAQNKVDKAWLKYRNIQSARYIMQNNPTAYFDYFSSLFSGNHSIAADITPSYCGLKANRLLQIKNDFIKRDIKVKAVILIRDPLSRIKSAVRFNLDRKNYNEGIGNGELNFNNALETYYKSEHCILRTNYEAIITEAKKVFSEEDLYVGIYENMFAHSQVERISKFFGVNVNIEYAAVKVNKTSGITEETNIDSIIKVRYADVYDFCFSNYPMTRELWG
jgi:hypothetical protein